MGAYSLKQIDRMRDAILERKFRQRSVYSICSFSEHDYAQAERQLRSYMQEGIEPEELEAAAEAIPYPNENAASWTGWKKGEGFKNVTT